MSGITCSRNRCIGSEGNHTMGERKACIHGKGRAFAFVLAFGGSISGKVHFVGVSHLVELC